MVANPVPIIAGTVGTFSKVGHLGNAGAIVLLQSVNDSPVLFMANDTQPLNLRVFEQHRQKAIQHRGIGSLLADVWVVPRHRMNAREFTLGGDALDGHDIFDVAGSCIEQIDRRAFGEPRPPRAYEAVVEFPRTSSVTGDEKVCQVA